MKVTLRALQRFFMILLMGCFFLWASTIEGVTQGWPTYRHDIQRSGVTEELIQPPFEQAWIYESPYPPQPAWPGPARRDGWHKVDNLKPRVIFDWAFHVVAQDHRIFFGSSVDDQVYCLDAKTGEVLWSYFTEAPIRLAPTIWDGKVYVGSDDGYIYCLNAKDGSFVWKQKPSEESDRVIGHDRMMSLWPIRSGILVEDGVAYCSAGFFPWEGVYLCAMQAEDGEILWNKKVDEVPPQGYMLASQTSLYLPTGSGTPAVFDRKSGDYQYSLGGSGGAFVILTEDMLVYGPGKTGELDAFDSDSRGHLATFQGNHMVVTAQRSYLHTDTEMRAIDRVKYMRLIRERQELGEEREKLVKQLRELDKKTQSEEGIALQEKIKATQNRLQDIEAELPECLLWKRECRFPYSLILAGETLYAGGSNEVAGFDVETGKTIWHAEVQGRALELAAADGRLIVSTDQGKIYGFTGK